MELRSGERVVERFNPHFHKGVDCLLPEALAKIDSCGRGFIIEEVYFGKPIGKTVCVATGQSDQIVYAKRPKRFGYSRFVKNREPEACNAMTVILKKDALEDYYILITAFVGYRPEPEPWDRNATANSRIFWDSHALVFGHEEIIPGSETAECPW